jgi:hypothetical protein
VREDLKVLPYGSTQLNNTARTALNAPYTYGSLQFLSLHTVFGDPTDPTETLQMMQAHNCDCIPHDQTAPYDTPLRST